MIVYNTESKLCARSTHRSRLAEPYIGFTFRGSPDPENAEFALACRHAGLVFVGPSPEAIRSIGNKAGAKRILQAAGVPCVPGYQGEDQDDSTMLAEAGRIGFPVMIKATAGGGGRGMRLVPDAASFLDLLRSARSEATSAFGDPEMILERAVVNPRHVEIQILGDRYGHVIHLGERDCSVQRRHQKVIEEAPSPAVPAARPDGGDTRSTKSRPQRVAIFTVQPANPTGC